MPSSSNSPASSVHVFCSHVIEILEVQVMEAEVFIWKPFALPFNYNTSPHISVAPSKVLNITVAHGQLEIQGNHCLLT